MIDVKGLPQQIRIVDESGRPTPEFVVIVQQIVRAVKDHEARITVLEP